MGGTQVCNCLTAATDLSGAILWPQNFHKMDWILSTTDHTEKQSATMQDFLEEWNVYKKPKNLYRTERYLKYIFLFPNLKKKDFCYPLFIVQIQSHVFTGIT